jgi:Flagellar hook-length control protein FliK
LIQAGTPTLQASKIFIKSEENSTSFPKLNKNEIINGKVLKSLSLSKSLLLIKGGRVIARTHVPLNEGMIISLKVEEVSPNPVLKLLDTKSKNLDCVKISSILSGIKGNLWKTLFEGLTHYPKFETEIKQFRQLMNDLSQRLFLKSEPDLLRRIIEKSGLCWEAKLKNIFIQKKIGNDNVNKLAEKDLKGLGLKILSLMDEKEVLLNRFLSTIENIQLLNHMGLEQDKKIFIPMPIQFPDGYFTVGQLLIQLNQKNNGDHEGEKKDNDFFKISFLLELSNLGPLRSDLTIKEKEIHGRFLLGKEETKLVIEENLPMFINTLGKKGFTVLHMECQIKEPEIVTQSLIKEIIKEEGCTISLVA